MLELLCFVIGSCCLLLGYLFYGLATRRGLVEPNYASWLIWGATTTVEALTYNAVNQGHLQNFIFLLSSLACIAVTVSVWQHSTWQRPTPIESICIAVCLAALVVWVVFQNAFWAHMLVLSIIPVSFLPTWLNLRQHPNQEQSPAWGLWTMGDISTLCLILISPDRQVGDLPYIVIECICHGSVWLFIGWDSINPFKTFHLIGTKIFSKTRDRASGNAFLVGRNHVGKAIYAGQFFPQGQPIVAFSGPTFHRDTLPASFNHAQDRFVQISHDYFMGPSGQVDDLINHSCAPNAGLKFHREAIVLVALRDIALGEELTWDYSTTIIDHGWSMRCRCGSPQCRSAIGEFRDIPEATQRAYAALGILPDYILDTIMAPSH